MPSSQFREIDHSEFVDGFDAVQALVVETFEEANINQDHSFTIEKIIAHVEGLKLWLQNNNPASSTLSGFTKSEEQMAEIIIELMRLAGENDLEISSAILAKMRQIEEEVF